MWIIDELPEENRIILLYDMFEGLRIGFFDAISQTFYDVDSNRLRDVCAWMYIPNKPNTFMRILDTVRHEKVLNTFKRTEGGTEDV